MGKNRKRLKLYVEFHANNTASVGAMVNGSMTINLTIQDIHRIYALPQNEFFYEKTRLFLSSLIRKTPEKWWVCREIPKDTYYIITLYKKLETKKQVLRRKEAIYAFFAPIAEFCDSIKEEVERDSITKEWVDAENKKAGF